MCADLDYKCMSTVVLVLQNIRSCHNVGSLLRSADGFGVKKVYICGITPFPEIENDPRLPHLSAKITKLISKTALGAEKTLHIKIFESFEQVVQELHADGYDIAAIEQSSNSVHLPGYSPPIKLALVVGNEVDGLSKNDLMLCDTTLEIPMLGQKESFNVSIAGAIVLYQITTAEKLDKRPSKV